MAPFLSFNDTYAGKREEMYKGIAESFGFFSLSRLFMYYQAISEQFVV